MASNGSLTLACTVSNTGRYAGEETVQLYLRDQVSAPLRPVKELIGFQKIGLQPGESKKVQSTITREQLASYNDQLQRVAVPGRFDLMIGASSADIRLGTVIELK